MKFSLSAKTVKAIRSQLIQAKDSFNRLQQFRVLLQLAESKGSSGDWGSAATLLSLFNEKSEEEMEDLGESLRAGRDILTAILSRNASPPPVASRQSLFGVGARVRYAGSNLCDEASPGELGWVRGVFFSASTERWVFAVKWDAQAEEDFEESHNWHDENSLEAVGSKSVGGAP